jgi:hypothetical protein
MMARAISIRPEAKKDSKPKRAKLGQMGTHASIRCQLDILHKWQWKQWYNCPKYSSNFTLALSPNLESGVSLQKVILFFLKLHRKIHTTLKYLTTQTEKIR